MRLLIAICIFAAGLAVGFHLGARWASSMYSHLYSSTAQEAIP